MDRNQAALERANDEAKRKYGLAGDIASWMFFGGMGGSGVAMLLGYSVIDKVFVGISFAGLVLMAVLFYAVRD